jgi:Tol biopolymer transport system component
MMQLTNQGRVQVAAISPDGKYVAYAVDEIGEAPRWDITGGQSKESLWIRQVNGGDLQAIPPLEARYGGMVFSADGDFLYFVRVDTDDRRRGRVYKMPVLGGNAQPILSGVELPYGLTLSPDGKRLAFIAESDDEVESRLMVANADGTGIRNSPFARSRQVSSACRGHLQGKRSQHSATTKRRTSPTGCPSR